MTKPILTMKRIRLGGIFLMALFTSANCIACACEGGMQNTGIGCANAFRDTVGLDIMPLYDNDGNRNGIPIDGSITPNKAYFDSLINQADASKRLYPIPSDQGLKNVEQMREKIVTREFTDQTKEFIRQGIKPFVGYITGNVAQPSLAGKLESVRCEQMGVFKTDRGGNYIGTKSPDGLKMYPIAISSQSFYATPVDATADKNTYYIEIGFDFSPLELDQNLIMIACNIFSQANYSVFMNRGLQDVCALYTNVENNFMDIQLQIQTADVLNPQLVKNLTVATDFVLKNVTQSTTPSIVVTQPTAGNYHIVYASGVSDGDHLKLIITHSGYDFTCVSNDDTIVPAS